ncbi:SagB family peptide dehydrogenase [Streptomyces sp. NPDC001389]|uniref:SagB family peptide dehydrogenase n=1 Tax=Streptomyces sp. NPDC001389 TaxID=3364569 RepID=UPI00369BF01B
MKTATRRTLTRLAFVAGVRVRDREGHLDVTRDGRTQFRIRGASREVVAALEGMTGSLAAPEPVPSPPEEQLEAVLNRVIRLLEHHIVLGDTVALRLEPLVPGLGHSPADVGADTPVRLNRFAFLRVHEGDLVLESPLSPRRARLQADPVRELAAALGAGTTAREQALALDLPVTVVQELLGHLAGASLVDTADEDGSFATDRDDVLRQWDFHDLLFHSRSRMGRHDYPFGGVFPYTGTIEPRPAVRPLPAGPVVALPRPRLEDIAAKDPSLTAVLEGRRSVRTHARTPLDLDRLGEFLYRCARVRAVTAARPEEGMPYPASSRPYPTGGASYDLELYLSVHRVAGLEPGMYFYDAGGHRLVLVNADEDDRNAMIGIARVSAGGIDAPDVLITVTSRFQRLSWKYRSLAYAATLKNVGVLYQTMYLVATGMGLAPCALGGGDSDLAARTLGLDYLQESSVGEFLLGSRPAPEELPPAGHLSWTPVNDADWHPRCERELQPAAAPARPGTPA